MAQPLMLATPASSAANEVGGITLPQEIVVVIVTPTAAQDQGQQNQGNQQGDQQGNQSEEGQAVAQAQAEGGGEAQGEASGEQQQGAQPGDQELINMGEQIYSSDCASCHQPNGEGTSAYPALAGSQVLTGEDPAGAIETVVNGRGQMPAFGDSLSPEEIAAVISYERNSWGNSAGVITADQVSQVQQGGGGQSAGEQSGGGAAQGEAQATPAPEGGTAEGSQEQGAPSPEAQGEQSGGTGEAQATPAPEGGSAQQAGASAGASSQVSVTQEQTGNVITIRIEIVVATPEAGAAPAEPSGAAAATGEAAPSDGEQTPAPQAEQPQETPAPEAAPSQATPAAETGSTEDQVTGTEEAEGDSGGEATAAEGGDQELINMGEQVYLSNCARCHQPDGEGTRTYPALAGSPVLTGEDGANAIEVVVNGVGQMPAFGDSLSAEEIAAVISYARNSWENSAGVVSADQVSQVQEGGGEATLSPEAEQPQETPAPEQAQATPAAEGGTPQSQGEASGEGSATQPDEAAAGGEQELLSMGEFLYGTTCANCHQLSGQGNTAYPSLVNNEIVTAEDPTSALLTILQGRGHMPSFAGLLSDQEIAAILSHERNAWGNNASVVTVEQVAQVRGSSGGDSGQAEATPSPEAQANGQANGQEASSPDQGEVTESRSGEDEAPPPDAQGMLDFDQFLEIPGVAALISYVRAIWNQSAPIIANARVQ